MKIFAKCTLFFFIQKFEFGTCDIVKFRSIIKDICICNSKEFGADYATF